MAALNETGEENDYMSRNPCSHHPVYGVFQTHGFNAHATDNPRTFGDILPIATLQSKSQSTPESAIRACLSKGDLDDTMAGPKAVGSHHIIDKIGGLKTRGISTEHYEGQDSPSEEKPDHEQTERTRWNDARWKDAFSAWPTPSPRQHVLSSPHLWEDGDGNIPTSSSSPREASGGIATSRKRDGGEMGGSSDWTGAFGSRAPAILGTSQDIQDGGGCGDGSSTSPAGDQVVDASCSKSQVLAHHPVFGVMPAFASIRLFIEPGGTSTENVNKATTIPDVSSLLMIGSDAHTHLPVDDCERRKDDQFLQAIENEPSTGTAGNSDNHGGGGPRRSDARDCLEVHPLETVDCRPGPVRRKRTGEFACFPTHDIWHVPSVLPQEDLSTNGRVGNTKRARRSPGELEERPPFLPSARVVQDVSWKHVFE